MKGRTLLLALAGAVSLTLGSLVAVPLLALRLSSPNPATPPLLHGVTAASGWDSGGCPRLATPAFDLGAEALSPDLTSRLAEAFPPGSDADRLQATLLAQGFHPTDPCRDDPAIRRALFVQSGSVSIRAIVAWKRSPGGQIVWTKGFVHYLAP